MKPIRVAVCADYPEEAWPSMDRVAGGLLAALNRDRGAPVAAVPVCPPFRRRAAAWSPAPALSDLDRGLNRFVDYPRHLRRIRDRYDVFHVVDHSYAHLVHQLPAARTIVTCHDLDAFRSILEPVADRKPAWFRAMSRHVFAGLRRAAYVTCDTAAVRRELVDRRIVAPQRAIVASLGVGDAFSCESDRESARDAERLVGARPGSPVILHVGSTSPRKRVDIVLRCFAAMRREQRNAQLVRVGGALTHEQEQLARALGILDNISVLPPLSDRMLAAIYRRAALLLLPSEREGFGLPVIEALRCGTPVLARDIPVLREVGSSAAGYCASADPDQWARAALAIVRDRTERPARWAARRTDGIMWARTFTWTKFASRLSQLYLDAARRDAIPARRTAACHA